MGDRALTFSRKIIMIMMMIIINTLYYTKHIINTTYLILTPTLDWYLSWILLAESLILQAGGDRDVLAW